MHPAEEPKVRLSIFLWRYFTGNHLDGRMRTNATWTKRATAPSHHMNWWSSKPRLHRMYWRWILFFTPVGWIAAYLASPKVSVNLTVFITLAILPYLLHHVTMVFVRLFPRPRVVIVHDTVHVDHVENEIDDIQVDPATMRHLMDMDITDEMEAGIPTDPPKRRRT